MTTLIPDHGVTDMEIGKMAHKLAVAERGDVSAVRAADVNFYARQIRRLLPMLTALSPDREPTLSEAVAELRSIKWESEPSIQELQEQISGPPDREPVGKDEVEGLIAKLETISKTCNPDKLGRYYISENQDCDTTFYDIFVIAHKAATALRALHSRNKAMEGECAASMAEIAALRHDLDRALAAASEEATRNKAMQEALEPSAETKAAYIGEFKFDLRAGVDEFGDDHIINGVQVPWPTIKEIMKAIRARALSTPAPE